MIIRRLLILNVALLSLILSALPGFPAIALDATSLVDVVVTKEVTKSKKDAGSRDTKDERIQVIEVVTIRNRSGRPLLKLDVTVVAEVSSDGGGMDRNRYKGLEQHFSIERMEIGKEEVMRCKPIQLQKFTSQSSTKSGRSVGGKFETKVRKVTVTVMEAGKQIWVTK